MLDRLQSLQKVLYYYSIVVWRTKAFWSRALVCWVIGAVLLVNDEIANHDLRFKMRGPLPPSSDIVLIDVSERDLLFQEPDNRNVLRPLKEVFSLTDAFYWSPTFWQKLLTKTLSENPAAVGITFFFGENVRAPSAGSNANPVFENEKIIWSADLDTSGRVLVPNFASTYNNNVGLRTIREDGDGIMRRFSGSSVHVPHLSIRLAAIAKPELRSYITETYQLPTLINFSGDQSSFHVVHARDVIEGKISPVIFRNKVVIIGSVTNPIEQVQTPLGRMSRTEVLANITENVLHQRTVSRFSEPAYLLILTILMMGAVYVLTSYPQSVTIAILVLSSILWTAASIGAFDILKIWIPVMSPLAMLTVTWILFLSYQLGLNERRTWRLQQEQKYLSEIEQLKTNFVSMMSHDLKTPIAKIQAICDRLLATSQDPDMAQDLKSLRRSSDELHRYIQSILQVTKVEAKDFKIQKEVTDLNENIEKVLSRLQPLAQEKNIYLKANLEPMFSIEVDTTLIQEVILNLIENAIKYTPEGGLVTVTSEEKDDNVMVVVEDTGPGIDPEDQKNIWNKFTRGRNQLETKGTGLGLYLVKYFVELHRGRVFLESELGRGTRVGFSIPLAETDAAEEITDVGALASSNEAVLEDAGEAELKTKMGG